MSRSISDIYAIFRRHGDRLREQQEETYRSIDDWHRRILKEIFDHTSKQKDIVRNAYEIHEKHLENIRGQVLELNNILLNKNDTTEIDQLLEKCRLMKVELTTINFASRTSQFIDVVLVEPPEQMYSQDYFPTKTTDRNSKIQSISSNDYASGYNTYPSTGATSFTPTSQPSTTTTSTYSTTQSIDNTENRTLRSNATGSEKLIQKCPICFMIFPSIMSEAGRTMHVNEHLSND